MLLNLKSKMAAKVIMDELSYVKNGVRHFKGLVVPGLKGITVERNGKYLVIIPKDQMAELAAIWQQGTLDKEYLVSSLKGDASNINTGSTVPITLYCSIAQTLTLGKSEGSLNYDFKVIITGASVSSSDDDELFERMLQEYKKNQ